MPRLATLTFVIFGLTVLPLPAQEPPPPTIPEGFMIIEQDLMVPVDWYVAESTHSGTSWPNGIVPFVFSTSGTSAVSPLNQSRTLAAMAEWEAVADVDFVPASGQSNRVLIVNSSVNSSMLGMFGGEQVINIADWTVRYILVHELGHCLGLHHEQRRPDRETFVTINFQNIDLIFWPQFDRDPNATVAGAYDFDSVMHYDQFAFSNNGQPTITCNPGFTQFQTTIGQRSHLSFPDGFGMSGRYGVPPPPAITSISPVSVTAGGTDFTLTITGTRFHRGSLDGSGIEGTRVFVGPTAELVPDSITPTQIEVTVPASMIANPGTITIDVTNTPPGGGFSNAVQLPVVCDGSNLALPIGPATSVTNPCQNFTITPAASEWNVVACSSSSNWNVTIGGVSSTGPGDDVDYVLANGRNGTISPVAGSFTRVSGTSPGVMLHDNAFNFTVGTTVNTSLAAGLPFRAYEFQVTTAGDYIFATTGSSSLYIRQYSAGSDAAWRPKGMYGFADSVGDPPRTRTLSAGWHCVVIYSDGPVTAAAREFSLSIFPATAPVAVGAAAVAISSTPRNFTVSPTSGVWNCVGVVSAATDWNIGIRSAESEFVAGLTDYLVADGHRGPIDDDDGIIFRASGSGPTTAQAPNRSVLTVGTPVTGQSWGSTTVLRLYEFHVSTADAYDFSSTGPSGLTWQLFEPGPSAAWQPRSAHVGTGPVGGPAATFSLGVGWHAIVVIRDAGLGSESSFGLSVVPTPNPVPALTQVTPLLVNAGIAGFNLTGTGSGFVPGSVVRWNGAALTTTFSSATSLAAAVPAILVAVGGTAAITVFSPAPGGGVSGSLNLVVMNPVPNLSSIIPSSAGAGAAAVPLVALGSSFNSASVVRWNGSPLATTFNPGGGTLSATVPASLLTAPGTASVTVFNPAPGGGTSAPRTFTINYGAPLLTGLSPSSFVAGSAASATVLLNGTLFGPASQARVNGSNVATTFVSAQQLSIALTGSLLQAPGSLSISVVNPAPGGGTSAALAFSVIGPTIFGLSPAQIAVKTPASPATTVSITGFNFTPSSVIHANGDPLPTTFVSSTTLQGSLGPTVLQTTRPGGVCMNVANTAAAVSNSRQIVVGGGTNRGLIRRAPLDPAPGEAYAALIEGGAANGVFSLYIDLENPAPLTNWPTPAAGMVLSVGPLVGSGSLFFPLIDGLGLVAPATGTALDAQGGFTLPGFTAPNPPVGIDLTIQALYLDPAALLGFNLTWARWPDSL